MAELENREADEDELAMLLLLLFADNDMDFWQASYRSPQWFDLRLRELGLQERLQSASIRAREGMLAELRGEIRQTQLNRRMDVLSDTYRHDLSARLARHHSQWLDEQKRAANERNWRLRRGEVIPEPPKPKPDDVYAEADAKREAVTGLTNWVSATELAVASIYEQEHRTKLEGFWRTESNPCPVCLKLSDTPKETWSLQFPTGPVAHPNCRCWLEWKEVLVG